MRVNLYILPFKLSIIDGMIQSHKTCFEVDKSACSNFTNVPLTLDLLFQLSLVRAFHMLINLFHFFFVL